MPRVEQNICHTPGQGVYLEYEAGTLPDIEKVTAVLNSRMWLFLRMDVRSGVLPNCRGDTQLANRSATACSTAKAAILVLFRRFV
jgi:hypothetical protein